MLKNRAFFTGLTLVLAAGSLWAAKGAPEAPASSEPPPQIEAVDVPTAEIMDPGTYGVNFRFYNGGGITSRLIIGPLKRVNLGLSFDTQSVIGSSDPHMIRPSIYFKLRMFDGTDVLPALAVGYDNQGYLYQQDIQQFLHREKGLYLVGSHEILVPDLEVHLGVNNYDFNDNTAIYGFTGVTYKVTSAFMLLGEYDNIRSIPDNRFNMGGRFFVVPSFSIDFAARNIGRGTSRGGERIVRLNYTANFPAF